MTKKYNKTKVGKASSRAVGPRPMKRIEIRCLKQLIRERHRFDLIQQYLNNYTIAEIKLQAKMLGFKYPKVKRSKKWSFSELEALKLGFKLQMSYRQIQDEFLGHRSLRAIGAMAQRKRWINQSHNSWTIQELNKIQQGIQNGLSLNEIIETYSLNRSPQSLYKIIRKQGWSLPKKWSETELFLLDLGIYNKLSLEQIQKESLPHRTLQEIEARVNIPDWNASLYDYNLFFSQDDIQLSCMAGFILADGHLHKKTYQIILNIAEKDLDFLEWICDVLKLAKQRLRFSKKYNSVNLLIPANIGRLFVKHFQLNPDKSFGKVVFPSFLNDQCLKAFLIGLLYGDGTLVRHKDKNRTINLTFFSTYDFLCKLLQYVQKNGFFNHYNQNYVKQIPTKTPGFDYASIQFNGRKAMRFCQFLFEPVLYLFWMDRKIQDVLHCSLLPKRKLPNWSEVEDQLLEQIFQNHPNLCNAKIVSQFQKQTTASVKRTQNSILTRASKLGLCKKKNKPWSETEDKRLEQLLKDHPEWGYDEITEQFQKQTTSSVKRNQKSIVNRINRLKLHFKFPRAAHWKETEDQLLEKLLKDHPDCSYDQITSHFQKQTTSSVKRTTNSIIHRINRLKLHCKHPRTSKFVG